MAHTPSSVRTNDSSPVHEPSSNSNSSHGCSSSMLKFCATPTADPSKPQSPPTYTILLKRAGAEFVGTFLLIFAAEGSTIMNEKTNGGLTYMGVALASGLAVMIIILSIGHISGAHLNPAVTLAFATIKEFPWSQVPFYFVSQLGASIVASVALKMILQYGGSAGLTVPSGTAPQAFVMEFTITFCLMFVVTAVATDTRAAINPLNHHLNTSFAPVNICLQVGELAGIAVGATVILNNLVAGAITGASMNPVRTLEPAIVAKNYTAIWVYILGPITGALAGTATYTLVRFNNPDGSLGRSIRR